MKNYGLLSEIISSIMIKDLGGGNISLALRGDQEEEIMREMIKVAVDAMGGDNAPDEIIKGAVEAVGLREDIKVFLVGREELIREKLHADFPEAWAPTDEWDKEWANDRQWS